MTWHSSTHTVTLSRPVGCVGYVAGIPVHVSDDCPIGTMYFWESRPGENMKFYASPGTHKIEDFLKLKRDADVSRKPYDQEADMPALGDPKPCSCTPQQEYYKTSANGDQLKRMNENQFNLIQQLRQEIIDLRCTWSPPANQGLHAVADLELIRELRGELEDAREQLSSLSEWELIAFNRLAVIDHLNNRVASMQSTIKQANELLNSELF